MILARDSAVPSLGEAAADDYEEIDVEDDDSETERYEIVQLMREQFGEREMTRSLVIDPTQDHMIGTVIHIFSASRTLRSTF